MRWVYSFKLICSSSDFESVEPQQFSNLKIVNAALMDPKLRALDGLFVELVVVLLLGNYCTHFEALLNKVLPDHAQDLVLLQCLPRNVQRRIFRIHDALDKSSTTTLE